MGVWLSLVFAQPEEFIIISVQISAAVDFYNKSLLPDNELPPLRGYMIAAKLCVKPVMTPKLGDKQSVVRDLVNQPGVWAEC